MNRRAMIVAVVMFVWTVLCVRAADDAAAATGPRDGKYRIMSYGAVGKPPLFLGSFELASGKYKAFLPGDKLQGEGTYSFDAASQTVKWDTGPYAGVWGGAFTIDREGKTHKIRLKSTTIATNNID
ncbi:MAG: hypothetical protein GC162_14610 [Planctomycetes bacterium]|nr:hypothetical protein [Planctomycetota bacterium]